MANKDWYNNKELFEMIQGLKDEMKETREVIKKYNGIRKDIYQTMERVQALEEQKKGKSEILDSIKDWGGWIVAVLTLLIYAMQAGII